MFGRKIALATLTAATALGGSLVAAPQAHAGAWDGKVVARSGVVVRSAPTTASANKGSIAYKKMIPLGCKVRGPMVDGNDIWYSLPPTTHEWVSARYIANVGRAPDWCDGGFTAKGKTTTSLSVRTGPSASNKQVGTLKKGATVKIVCKVRGQKVDGNNLWYFTTGRRWVSARYVTNIGKAPGWCVD